MPAAATFRRYGGRRSVAELRYPACLVGIEPARIADGEYLWAYVVDGVDQPADLRHIHRLHRRHGRDLLLEREVHLGRGALPDTTGAGRHVPGNEYLRLQVLNVEDRIAHPVIREIGGRNRAHLQVSERKGVEEVEHGLPYARSPVAVGSDAFLERAGSVVPEEGK